VIDKLTATTRDVTANEINALADRMLERAVNALLDVPPEVRSDMLLSVACLRVLSQAVPAGVTIDVLKAVTSMSALDAAKLADRLAGMDNLETYARSVADLQMEIIVAARLIKAMLRQVHSSDVFVLSPDYTPPGHGN
jgi:hypothetical protein